MPTGSRQFGSDRIVLGSFTLPRSFPFARRLALAREAGVDGIGLFMAEWEELVAGGMTVDLLERMLIANGLVLAELDLINLGATGDYAERGRRFQRHACELAERFEVRYLQALAPAVTGDRAVADPASFEQVADEFGRLCDLAGEVGLLVGIEYVPYTTIKTASDAVALVSAAGRRNGGVCVDVWHHRRGGSPDDLASVFTPDLVLAVQVNDGTRRPADPDYKTDCLVNRLPPGEGEFDTVGLVRQLIQLGVDVPWTVEVCRDADLDHSTHVEASVAGMRAVLAAARRPAGSG